MCQCVRDQGQSAAVTNLSSSSVAADIGHKVIASRLIVACLTLVITHEAVERSFDSAAEILDAVRIIV